MIDVGERDRITAFPGGMVGWNVYDARDNGLSAAIAEVEHLHVHLALGGQLDQRRPPMTSPDPGRGVPAAWCNRFYVWREGDLVRIAFAEEIGDDDKMNYRQAVIMTRQNALELAELIDQTAKMR